MYAFCLYWSTNCTDVGFLNDENILFLRRILRRFAGLSGRNKETYASHFIDRLKNSIDRQYGNQQLHLNIAYQTRNKTLLPTVNKARSQKSMMYIAAYRCDDFINRLFDKLT